MIPELLPVPDGGNNEPFYLVDAVTSLPYPFPDPPGSPEGRQFNPLLEPTPGNVVQDPWYDPALNPAPTTQYYDLNGSTRLTLLDQNVGFENIHVFYNGALSADVQFSVTTNFPGISLWRNGAIAGIIQGAGDNTIAAYSAHPDDLWPGYQAHDLFVPDIPGQERDEEHALLPLYPEAQHDIGAVLTDGLSTPFSTPLGLFQEQFQRDDPNNKFQKLTVVGMSPIELMVVDPTGRRLGYDVATSQVISEIPLGFYEHPVGGLATLVIYAPIDGDYTLETIGTGSGDYTIAALYSDELGTAQLLYETDTIQSGEVRTDEIPVPVESAAALSPPEVSAGPDLLNEPEGMSLDFSGSIQDLNPGDTHTIAWDFGDGGAATGTLTPSHAYADNSAYTVTLTVSDSSGFVVSDTLEVIVDNVPPIVQAGPDQTVNLGDEIGFAGSFTDPGTLDTHTIEWDFGDGNMASDTLTPAHTYANPGPYAVTLTVTDDDGEVGSGALQVTVTTPPTTVCTLPELDTLLADLYAQGQVDINAYEQLRERLDKAQRELDKDKPDKAAEKLWDFVERVNRETGTGVDSAAAAALKDGAFCILGALGVDEAMLREIESLRAQVEDAYAQGLIDQESVRDRLVERLEKAQERVVKGEPDKAADELDKFMETVGKEQGKHIDAATADSLLAQAQALIDTLEMDDADDGEHDDDDGDDEGDQEDKDEDDEDEDD